MDRLTWSLHQHVADTGLGGRAHVLFLFIAVPAVLLLCFLTGPFEGADETAHYLRMVAVADGNFLPVVSPSGAPKKSAGAYEDSGAALMAMHAQDTSGYSLHHYSWPKIQAESKATITRRLIFAPHSNTAIYPPFLYAASAATTFVAEREGLRPLWWLYLGRLANALVGIAIVYTALRKAGDANLFLFVAAVLPVTLYQFATLSADALLFPLLIAFAVLLLKMQRDETQTRAETFALSVITVVACAGKVAYLPLAILPPIAARLADRSWSRRALFFTGVAVTSVFVWAAWAFAVRDEIFSIRPNMEIDPKAQLEGLIAQPARAAELFLRSAAKLTPRLAIGSVGARLGWGDLSLPSWLIYPLPFLLAASALPADYPEPRSKSMTRATLFAAVACYWAIFLLIYLQFNAVGARRIEGLQGRYFTPIAIVALALTPRLQVGRAHMRGVWVCMVSFAVISTATTLVFVERLYW